MSGKTACWLFCPFTRRLKGRQAPPRASFPRTRESMTVKKTRSLHVLSMGPRLRGDDAAARFNAHFHVKIRFNCRF